MDVLMIITLLVQWKLKSTVCFRLLSNSMRRIIDWYASRFITLEVLRIAASYRINFQYNEGSSFSTANSHVSFRHRVIYTHIRQTIFCVLYFLLLCVKKNQIDAQLILSIFRQTLRVSGVSMSIIRRYNRM